MRRRRASFSSIKPAERSASIAICLPGMASRWSGPPPRRSARSLGDDDELTITRMVKTMMPMTSLPSSRTGEGLDDVAAAAVPSWHGRRIFRVAARSSASRGMVAISSTLEEAENSSGACMNRDVIRISTEKVIEMASAKSSRSDGSGE